TIYVIADKYDLCPGYFAELIAYDAFTFEWSPATGLVSTTGSINYAGPGSTTTYTVVGTDYNGCKDDTTITINVFPQPNITIDPPYPSFCDEDSVEINITGGAHFQWTPSDGLSSDTSGSVTAIPDVTTSYVIDVQDINGCTAIQYLTVTVFPNTRPEITVIGDLIFCSYDSVYVEFSVPANYASYDWSNSLTNNAIIVTQPGDYWVSTTDYNNCTYTSESISVIHLPPFDVWIYPDGQTQFCEFDSVKLYADTAYAHYIWSSGSVTPYIKVTETGYYYVSVRDQWGCEGTSNTIFVNVIPMPESFFTYSDTLLTVYFYALGESDTTWYWTFGDGATSTLENPVHTYDTTGTYTVTLNSGNSCGNDIFTLDITVVNPSGIAESGVLKQVEIFPNPVNDVLTVRINSDYTDMFELNIFDTRGRLLYKEGEKGHQGEFYTEIDVSRIAAGVYYLFITTDEGSVPVKLVKE
ncbi:MAG: T9SS type A sorting domain-containing protein, partial [Bacteroidetes bacterium]|nr:T9SS type A sorting domain-containing protein [Bacteroidota bacterium]